MAEMWRPDVRRRGRRSSRDAARAETSRTLVSAPGATFVDSRFDFADLSGEKLDGVVFEAGRHEAVGGRLDELFSLRWL